MRNASEWQAFWIRWWFPAAWDHHNHRRSLRSYHRTPGRQPMDCGWVQGQWRQRRQFDLYHFRRCFFIRGSRWEFHHTVVPAASAVQQIHQEAQKHPHLWLCGARPTADFAALTISEAHLLLYYPTTSTAPGIHAFTNPRSKPHAPQSTAQLRPQQNSKMDGLQTRSFSGKSIVIGVKSKWQN